jgi:hypothetical protein
MAVSGGDALGGLRNVRGALLVHAAEIARVVDEIDAEIARQRMTVPGDARPGLDPEPLQLVGLRALAARDRRRRRMAARP